MQKMVMGSRWQHATRVFSTGFYNFVIFLLFCTDDFAKVCILSGMERQDFFVI